MDFNNFTIKSQEAVQKAMEIAAAKTEPGHRNFAYLERDAHSR